MQLLPDAVSGAHGDEIRPARELAGAAHVHESDDHVEVPGRRAATADLRAQVAVPQAGVTMAAARAPDVRGAGALD